MNNHVILPSKDHDAFYVYWESLRNLILYKISPYSVEISIKIQNHYSIELLQEKPFDYNVSYPLYGGILFLPFALINDYAIARAMWTIFLECCLASSIWFCMRITCWRPGIAIRIWIFICTFIWFFCVVPLITGHIIVLVSLFTLLSILAISEKYDELAGISLTLTTIIPQVACILWLFLGIWAFFQKRWKLLIWMIGSLIVLAGSASLIIPDWILQYIRVLRSIFSLKYIHNPIDIFKEAWPGIGAVFGIILAFLSILILAIEWWLARKGSSRRFIWTVSLTLVVTQWSGIPTNPSYFVILLLPMFVIYSTIYEHWDRKARWFIIGLSVMMSAGFWIPFINRFNPAMVLKNYPIHYFLLPLLLVIGLYWIRWWTLRPQKISLTKLYSLEEI